MKCMHLLMANITIDIQSLPLSVFGVSSHLFFFPPGVPWPGVAAPGVACPGVDSQRRVLGVAPGVSLPLALPGVSSH